MADLFTGPRSLSPWLEGAVVERLQQRAATPMTTRIAHILRKDDDMYGLLTDGHLTALVRSSVGESLLPTGIVRLQEWRIVVEQSDDTSTIPSHYTPYGVYQHRVTIVVQVSCVEPVGQVTSPAPSSPSILTSPNVLRHLQPFLQHQRIADVGALVLEANQHVDTLIHIAQLSADPLPVGNLGAVLWEDDAQTLDALVASAVSPIAAAAATEEEAEPSEQEEEPTAKETVEAVDLTMDSSSDSDDDSASGAPPPQGIQAMLMDDEDDDAMSSSSDEVVYMSTSPPLKAAARQQLSHERSNKTTRPAPPPPPKPTASRPATTTTTQEPLQPTTTNRPRSHLVRPTLSRDDSLLTIPHSNRSVTTAGDWLRQQLVATTATTIALVAPPLEGIQTQCAGDDIRMWLADLS